MEFGIELASKGITADSNDSRQLFIRPVVKGVKELIHRSVQIAMNGKQQQRRREEEACRNCGKVISEADSPCYCPECGDARGLYCSRRCQRSDARKGPHGRGECRMWREEDRVARAAAAADPKAFSSVSTGEELRDILVDLDGEKGPLLFCAKELRGFLEEASRRWEDDGLAKARMDLLLDEIESCPNHQDLDWLRLSSLLFGTCMVHSAIHRQRRNRVTVGLSEEEEEGDVWFEAFIHNFGEFLDRVKLFAMLQQNDHGHLLPSREFPLLPLSWPSRLRGRAIFPPSLARVGDHIADEGGDTSSESLRCFVCGSAMTRGAIGLAPHSQDRSDLMDVPRLANFLPPRPPLGLASTADMERAGQKLRAWIRLVTRTKRIPRLWVCGDGCEQHATYGRLFEAHPLEKKGTTN